MTGADRNNTSLAAEFFVVSQLFRRGYVATITLGRTKSIDIVVTNPLTRKSITVDVKGLRTKTNWPIHEPNPQDTHFYALVCYEGKFKTLERIPQVFIVPSTEMKEPLLEPFKKGAAKGDYQVRYKTVAAESNLYDWNRLFDALGEVTEKKPKQ